MAWSSPSLVLLGFVALIGVVILLGRSSTARFEGARFAFEGNGAAVLERAVVAASAGSVSSAPAPLDVPSRQLPAAAAGHPAGRGLSAARTATWWLTDDAAEDPAAAVVAGPFDDRIDAEWAALANGLAAGVRPAYGVLGTDGVLIARDPGS